MLLLDKVTSPADLRNMPVTELPVLAAEIRERIVSVISESGGHLASSLGAVELALALHYVYDTPVDKIVWDVGHQCYAHKLITGRNESFHTIRQHGGISGFPNTEESEYDCMTMGHASTSISGALGMAMARDIKKETFHVVAVIGDGSMTGGLAYEGLNNAGARKTNLTVILNDNSMSISKNVGAMSHYLTRVIADPLYNRLKKDIWDVTGKMRGVGKGIRTVMARVDEGVKHLLIPGKLFEDLGFRYFGVVNGHNLGELIAVLRNVRNNITGPVLIHVQTVKGKGCEFAEREATKFHGVGRFEKETGEVQKPENAAPSYTEIFGRTMVALGREEPALVGITAAMPDGTGLKMFGQAFPDRFFDVGIAESHAVTFAAGLALQGLRPVVAVYSTFLQRAFDQIVHDVALSKLPVIFCLDRAGLVGDDGPTHHGCLDLSYVRLIPNTVIMAPKDEDELRHMLKTAVDYKAGPIFIRYPRGAGLGVPLAPELKSITIGEPEMLLPGNDVLLLALGSMVHQAEQAAQLLKASGISAAVVNARFAKPVTGATFIKLYEEFERIVTIEANTVAGGFGSGIGEAIQALGLKRRLLALGYPDAFVGHGDKNRLHADLGLSAEGIARQVRDWCGKTLPGAD